MAKTDQELAQELSDQLGLDWRSQYSGRNREQVPRRTQTISADRPTIRSALSNLMRDAIDATGIGGGYRRGLLNAAGGIETGVDFTPVLGDALALEDAAQAYRRGDLIDTGINLIGAIPIAGEFLSKGAKLTKEQIEEGAMSSLREALNVPIEKFRALMGAPRYGGPLSGSGYNARDSRWAMISAENPPNQRLTDAENIRRSEELGEYLIKEYGPDNISLVKGDYGGPERTYLVEGIDPIAAANIGNRYGQDSVFTDRGILYTSGSGRMGQREQISPLTGRYGEPVYQPNIDPDLTSFYTELQPKTGDPIRLSFNIDANTPLTYPSGDLTPASARGVHFSNQAGLTETDPIHYGEGSAGAEKAFVGAGRRAYGEGPLRTYFYTPSGLASDVVPEPVVTGANRYQTTLRDLYDITTDPEGIRAFSKGPVDMERMIESRGYTGYISNALANPEAGRTGSAAVFSRQPVISTDAAEAISGIMPRSALNILDPNRVPERTQTAYKLFRTDAEGNLYPLFVNANQQIPVGEWLPAEAGEMLGGKVKSKIGALAYRPGWHAGDLPIATHIGDKFNPQTLLKDKTLKAPNVRPDNQVWAEVEMPADYDWQTEALNRAQRNKAGEIIPRTAHITEEIPYGGHYRYKTNPNMTGEWLIGGQMRVNRVLGDDEVRAINEAAGVSDLPRLSELQRMQSGAYQASRVAADPRVADNPVAMRMNDQIASDFDGAIQRYSQIDRTKGGKVINADYARELSDDYLADRTLANEVQAPSSEFARALFDRRLSETQGQDGIWILTGGGTASGKSAGVSGEVEDLADLVYDGTMKDFDKTDRMVSAAADSGKKVRLVYVDRDPDKALPLYFNRARDEGRTVPLDVFVDSHRGARDTIRRLSEKYADDPRVDIQIWSNQGREGEQKIIDISELSDFDADEIMPRLERMVDEEYEQGKISTAVYNATKGRL